MTKILLIASVLAIITVLVSCNEDSITIFEEETQPEVTKTTFPEKVWVKSNYDLTVTALVNDGKPGQIDYVIGTITFDHLPQFEAFFVMYDDETNGDNIPFDDEFTATVSSSIFEGISGSAQVEFTGGKSANKPFSPVGTSLSVNVTAVDEFRNTPPVLSNLIVPDSVRYDLEEKTTVSIEIFDEQGINDLAEVSGYLYAPFAPVPFLTIPYNIDSTELGTMSGSGTIQHAEIAKQGMGIYTFLTTATDKSGNKSNEIIRSIVFSTDQIDTPPEIVSLSVPDSIRADNSLILFKAEVFDANGLSDIEQVYFLSIKPDGNPGNNGNPIYLYDDGGTVSHGGVFSGDAAAGDGIFSVTIRIPSEADRGTFTFRFQAADTKGLKSPFVEHKVVVY